MDDVPPSIVYRPKAARMYDGVRMKWQKPRPKYYALLCPARNGGNDIVVIH